VPQEAKGVTPQHNIRWNYDVEELENPRLVVFRVSSTQLCHFAFVVLDYSSNLLMLPCGGSAAKASLAQQRRKDALTLFPVGAFLYEMMRGYLVGCFHTSSLLVTII
jgi:hypothetical protein